MNELEQLMLLLASNGITVIHNVYRYGSTVYGTASEQSDTDYIVVASDEYQYVQLQAPMIDVTVYGETDFKRALFCHDVTAVECVMLPYRHVLKQTIIFDFEPDTRMLRESFSAKASNSFVKAKKKLTVPADYAPHTARKSLFHSLRIIDFGIQLAMVGTIDFDSVQHYWQSISRHPADTGWEIYKAEFQPIYNGLKSTFRIITNA